jgi:hypothetical protein
MFEKTGKPTKEKLQEIEEGIYYFWPNYSLFIENIAVWLS